MWLTEKIHFFVVGLYLIKIHCISISILTFFCSLSGVIYEHRPLKFKAGKHVKWLEIMNGVQKEKTAQLSSDKIHLFSTRKLENNVFRPHSIENGEKKNY